MSEKLSLKERLDEVLKEIGELLAYHGGGVELIEFDEPNLRVKLRLTGACGGCPLSRMTFEGIVKQVLLQRIPELKEIEYMP